MRKAPAITEREVDGRAGEHRRQPDAVKEIIFLYRKRLCR